MKPYLRGRRDCYQDHCENIPFASIGGLEQRHDPQPPAYADEAGQWLSGYLAEAQELYGEDWRTCSFGWSHALTIKPPLDKAPADS